jgi:four helix bundle protein
MENFNKEFKSRLYSFTLFLIETLDNMPATKKSSNVLAHQLMRSGTSVIANYIEGQSSVSTKELLRYLAISLKSANESKLWISLLKDTKNLDEETSKILLKELIEISKIIAKSILSLKQKLKEEKK